jgi:hypothetical protein
LDGCDTHIELISIEPHTLDADQAFNLIGFQGERSITLLQKKIVSDLFSSLHGLHVYEQKETLRRILESDRVKNLLLDYGKNAKATKSKFKVLKSVSLAYTHMTLNKSSKS